MKRQRDGDVRTAAVEDTRKRCLEQLRLLVSSHMYQGILHLETDRLLSLLASLRPEELLGATGANTE